jgi:hypothetical protein
MASPSGIALYSTKTAAGLFNGSSSAKEAARQSLEKGYVRVVRSEPKGKALQEICTLTDKGLAYLLGQVSPKQIFEDFVRAIEGRQSQLTELVAAARQTHTTLNDLRTLAAKVLLHIEQSSGNGLAARPDLNGAEAWKAEMLSVLTQWPAGKISDDYPLPELYRQVKKSASNLTIGHFHDALRHFHEQGQLYLHPWTGPLYELPEPAFALLIGHEIAYYASPRQISASREENKQGRDRQLAVS